MERRDQISANIKRQLWAQCGGYCQNPNCNKYLFANIENELVSLANIAHIIGLGKASPRSENELSKVIDKNGLSNLIMLCLECHKIVDEIEAKYSIEEMRLWKANHLQRIKSIFEVPVFTDENNLLEEVNDLLEVNKSLFEAYGPFSRLAMDGASGDTNDIWKRKCLGIILPNNQRIIDIFEKNKRNFTYPWESYWEMLKYKVHADSFRENCLVDEKVNDYKLFPPEFNYYVKSKLGIPVEKPEVREREEIEIRHRTISDYINRFLKDHSFIADMKKRSNTIFEVNLIDGRSLRVFVTNTYHFTEYTFEKIMAIDPNIDAIICSTPYTTYSESAKKRCIEEGVGLFMLGEFMGAIPYKGENFLNYLLKKEKRVRIDEFSKILMRSELLVENCSIYLMGSYLRRRIYNDIDIVVVYKNGLSMEKVDALVSEIRKLLKNLGEKLHFVICSSQEFLKLTLEHDNSEKVL